MTCCRLSLSLVVFLIAVTSTHVEGQVTDSFYCTIGNASIPRSRVCDGQVNCADRSDETPTACKSYASCAPGDFKCNVTSGNPPACIPRKYVCDGFIDCYNGEDERTADCTRPLFACSARFRACNDSDGRCINTTYLCDGISDCHDGGDEKNCSYPVCPSNWFQCTYGLCIDPTKTCDGVWDCRDGSDESNNTCSSSVCNVDTQLYCPKNSPDNRCVNMTSFCTRTNFCPQSRYVQTGCYANECSSSPCSESCVDLTYEYKCTCNAGRQLNTDGITCSDINECATTPWVCPQICTNTVGSYKCSCGTGYTSSVGGTVCTRTPPSPDPYLLFGNRYAIRKVSTDGTNYTAIPGSFAFVHVIAADFQIGYIFFMDISHGTMNRMRLDGSGFSVIESYYSSNVEGIAVDNVNRKIYWTTTRQKGIYVSELNGTYVKAIVSDQSPNCRGIAVHPIIGFLYWTDWGNSPFIARVGLDGSQMSKIITTDVYWPNGITIDFQSDRIFWADAGLSRIAFADLNGQNRRNLAIDTAYLSHPYGITVFENYVYWTDWNYKTVNRADKWTGGAGFAFPLGLSIIPYDIKTVHPLRDANGVNPCGVNNGGCSHLCLIAPGGKSYTCACPQQMKLNSDNRTCNVTCSSPSEFLCSVGEAKCIPWYMYCDGVADCLKGEDEPANCSVRLCPRGQWQCSSYSGGTACIQPLGLCNGFSDCADRSDENSVLCITRVCQLWEYKCASTGKCIPITWKCDGYIDCPLAEDESAQLCNNNSNCLSTQFRCNNPRVGCIPLSWYCDFDDDCEDMSDEPPNCWEYRFNNSCPAGYKQCPGNYRCVPASKFCDGSNDCRDYSDEDPQYCSCRPGEFQCDNKRCIPNRWRCDCANDCGDESDENTTMCLAGNFYRQCTPGAEFRCDKCRCISQILRCNGNQDCADGTDELNCTCPNNSTFTCTTGRQCIDISLRCNGHKDCVGDMSDEIGCPPPVCTSSQFMCNDSLTCIPSIDVCNGIKDCNDGSDEVPTACFNCSVDQFQCPVLRQCIARSQVCDGNIDCAFGADEMNCCSQYEMFQCNNLNCVNQSQFCDYVDNCGDMSDEINCTVRSCSMCSDNCTTISPGQYVCTCKDGYEINPLNTLSCTDTRKCNRLQDNWCPQVCKDQRNTDGTTYKCLCAVGFQDGSSSNDKTGRNCQPSDNLKGTLIYGTGRFTNEYNITSQLVATINGDAGSLIFSLDVDSINSITYWVDGQGIKRAAIPKNISQVSVTQTMCDVVNAQGIAIDWITKNVYWTQPDGVFVTSSKVVCMRVTLLLANVSNQFQPGPIVVDPLLGLMFIINTHISRPTIMSASMDGSQLQTLIGSGLHSPSGLTIDYNMNSRLFWTDPYRDVIESCNYDGSDRVVIVPPGKGSQPYKLDIFSGTVYWTTYSRDRLLKADSVGQGNVSVILSGQTTIGPLRLTHWLRYGFSTVKTCQNSTCTMCLINNSGGFKCVCPDGVAFKNGSTTQCNISTSDPQYATLPDPLLCDNPGCFSTSTTSTATSTTIAYPSSTSTTATTSTSTSTSSRTSTRAGASTSTNTSTSTSTSTSSSTSTSTSTSTGTSTISSASSGTNISTSPNSLSSSSQISTRSSSSTSALPTSPLTLDMSTITPIGIPTTTTTSTGSDAGQGTQSSVILAIVLPIVLGGLLIGLVVLFFAWRCKRSKTQENNFSTLNEDTVSTASSDYARSRTYGPTVKFDSSQDNISFPNPMFSVIEAESHDQELGSAHKTLPASAEMNVPDDNFMTHGTFKASSDA